MNEKPILFSTPMVQAILAGRKTQTRRTKNLDAVNSRANDWLKPCLDSTGEWVFTAEYGPAQQERIYCPYGKPGDVLWVRETYLWVMRDHAHNLLEGVREDTQWMYKASIHEDWMKYAKEKFGYKWKPSIHMPKAAARIWLEITNVRVERLQDICENDAEKEGIEKWYSHIFSETRYKDYQNILRSEWRDPRTSFMSLWLSINGIESWEANPYVWVIEFKRI